MGMYHFAAAFLDQAVYDAARAINHSYSKRRTGPYLITACSVKQPSRCSETGMAGDNFLCSTPWRPTPDWSRPGFTLSSTSGRKLSSRQKRAPVQPEVNRPVKIQGACLVQSVTHRDRDI
jgi:hypothetical protein